MSIRKLIVGLYVAVLCCGQVRCDDELRIDDIMTQDPKLVVPDIVWQYHQRLKPLWELALNRPEGEVQRLAADTIAIAHRRGMPDLESAAEQLVKTLQKPETSPTVRRAATHAIIALEAKQHVDVLVKAADQHGLDLQAIVEPALAKWGNNALRETWRRRLADETVPPRLRMLAIEGLGALSDSEAKPQLLALVMNRSAPHNQRLAAADSLVKIGSGGMLAEARELLANKTAIGFSERVLAVHLLSADRDEQALVVLCELANDSEPSVAAAAMNRVFDVDPPRVFPLATQALKNADVNVRRVGVRALVLRADVPAIEAIAPFLDDPNPSLRRLVNKGLFDLAAKPDLKPAVITAAEQNLKVEGWRALEQAAILVGHLDHKPTADRLIELLQHRRDEVAVSTAWALRKFKIPETLPAILAHSNYQHERHVNMQTAMYERPCIYQQQSQLFQLYGEVKLKEADPLMRNYIPKMMGLGDARPAACWALGMIHEGNGPPDLVDKFVERLMDINSMPPEIEPVRIMCAISLGRMKAQAALPALKRCANENSEVGLACWWSIQQITGEKPPGQEPAKFHVLGWFLQPSDG